MRVPLQVLALAVGVLSVTACTGPGPDVDPLPGIEVAGGFELVEVAGGLSGPTQATWHPDGRLIVAELNGGENDGTGRVAAIDVSGGPTGEPAPEVLVEGLVKPTGVAVIADELWIMEQRRLSRAPLDGGPPTVVLDSLPFNGRSETTLTVTPEGHLLYATTGTLVGGRPAEGSGVLWELGPGPVDGPPPVPSPVSAGFKNAYGHTIGPDGTLWVTEVSDGSFDGAPAPDELVQVTPGIDHGWPACVGDRQAVTEFGGDPATCAAGPPSLALFGPGATPTSVAVAPWDPGTLVVALWRERRVVAVPAERDGSTDPPHGPEGLTDVLAGEGFRPQHLLVDGDRLLVVDHGDGRILALSPT
jgi:glucose/arabinose dehydrogenase